MSRALHHPSFPSALSVLLGLLLCAAAVPVAWPYGDTCDASDVVFHDHWQVGNPEEQGWRIDENHVGVELHAWFTFIAGASYDVYYPVRFYPCFFASGVLPGKPITLALVCQTQEYENGNEPWYKIVFPGFSAGIVLKVAGKTVYENTKEFLPSREDYGVPDLGVQHIEHRLPTYTLFSTSVKGFEVAVALRGKQEMQRLRVEPSRFWCEDGTMTVPYNIDPNEDYWDGWRNNGDGIFIGPRVADGCCAQSGTLYTNLAFHYDTRPNFDVIIYFDGYKIFEFDFDRFLAMFSNNGWADNHALGLGNTETVPVTIPINQDPDLEPKTLVMSWCEAPLPPDYPDELSPAVLPCLEARVRNVGCGTTDEDVHITFWGVNNNQFLGEAVISPPWDPGTDRTVHSDPIIFWDTEFEVVVDAGWNDETDKTNNKKRMRLESQNPQLPDLGEGTRLIDELGNLLNIGIPDDYGPGDGDVITPTPIMPNPLKVEVPDPCDPFGYFDFSYIYDLLNQDPNHDYVVKLPDIPAWMTDPGTVQRPIYDGQQFAYEIYDAINGLDPQNPDPSKLIHTDEYTIRIPDMPDPPNFTIDPPAQVGDYGMENLVIDAPGYDALRALVQHFHFNPGYFNPGPHRITTRNSVSIVFLPVKPGLNEITITGIDEAGNAVSIARDVVMTPGYDPNDHLAPSVHIRAPQPDAYIADLRPTIEASASDRYGSVQGSGIDQRCVCLVLDGVTYDVLTGVEVRPGNAITFTPPAPLSEGPHAVEVRCVDSNDNSASAEATFHVDTIPPSVVGVNSSGSPFTPPNTIDLEFTLDEDASVTITVYAGGSVAPESLIGTAYTDNDDPNTFPTYRLAGPQSISFDGQLDLPESDNGGYVGTPYALDAGLYTFVVTATDRAGHTGTGEGTFTVQYDAADTISAAQGSFALDSDTVSGCTERIATLTLNNALGQPVARRIVQIAPDSTANRGGVVNDVFFDALQADSTLTVAVTDQTGEVRFPVQCTTAGSREISCSLMVAGSLQLVGPGQSLDVSCPCPTEVQTGLGVLDVAGAASVCKPYSVKTLLVTDGNDPVPAANAIVAVRATSSRGAGLYDHFFELDADPNAFHFVESDPNGMIHVPVRSTAPGTPTFTLYLDDGTPGGALLAEGAVGILGVCEDPPAADFSTAIVTPLGDGEADIELTLRDAEGLPLGNTTYRIEPISNRNLPHARPQLQLDLFGDPPRAGLGYSEILTTDPNGTVHIPMRSLKIGDVEVTLRVQTPEGDVDVVAAAAMIDSVASDLVDNTNSTFVIDPVDPNSLLTTGWLTLVDDAGEPLPDVSVGVRVMSSRNDIAAFPVNVHEDFFFTRSGRQKPIVACTTDMSGTIAIPIHMSTPGAANICVSVATRSGFANIACPSISVEDDDFDNIPNAIDDYPGTPNRIDCDSDGVPDPNDIDLAYGYAPDTDGDRVFDYCDDCLDPPGDDRIDTDLDGVPDCADAYPCCANWRDCNGDGVPDCADADADWDGVSDTCDNCLGVYNPRQEDHNGNFVGDACEACGCAPAGCPGDYDCDGDRDYFDISYFIAALNGEAHWTQYYRDQHGGADPPCSYAANCDADGQGDGTTYFDIQPFIELLGQPCE